MLGIFIASLLAAVMSSCDSFMIASSGLFTENIYKVLRTNESSRHYVWVGRIVSLLVVIAGIAVAYSLPGVVAGLKVWYKVVPMMGIAFWLGLLWRRTTVAGAWASALGGFVAWWLVTQQFFVRWAGSLGYSDPFHLVVENNGSQAIYEPWQITFYLGAGVLSGVLVSFFTPAVASERLERFYTLTRTPIQPNEKIESPCTLPKGVSPTVRPMLLSACGFEIPRPSVTSLVGFVAGWVCVCALILGFIILVSW
jgi:Na+/proline symporter